MLVLFENGDEGHTANFLRVELKIMKSGPMTCREVKLIHNEADALIGELV